MKGDFTMSHANDANLNNAINAYIANIGVGYIKLHNLHWNVVGPQFKAVHEYLESLYDAFADVLDETADYVRTFDVSDREMDKFIIGTMSGVDAPMTPQMKGDIAATFHLRGITQEDRQRARDEILMAQQADIRALAPLIADAMQANVRCVLGGEEKIRENAALFDAVRPALRM